MCFPQETFSAPENASCSNKYNMPQEISSNAGNIPQRRKYFLLKEIFLVTKNIAFPIKPAPVYIPFCPGNSSCHKKYFLPQEIFPVQRYISLS